MRVLIVGLNYEPEATGVAPYTAGLAKGLVQRGHDVQVITTMPHYPEWRVRDGYEAWSRREQLDGVQVLRLKHFVPRTPIGVARLLSEISFGARVLTSPWGAADLVIFVSPALFSTAMGLARARLRHLPSAVWVQDLYSLGIVQAAEQSGRGVAAKVIEATESWVLRAASRIVVIHERFVPTVKRLGAPESIIQVVRNWTHVDIGTSRDTGRIRATYGWDPAETVALHTGNMGVKQDLGNLVEAARMAHGDGAPVRFVFTGGGSARQALEQQSEGLPNVQFLDALPEHEYAEALGAADVLLVNECSGLRDMAVPSKLTSYFAAGRPVVAATDSESVTAAEILVSGGGIRVDPAQPERLLDGILRLRDDAALAGELAANGKAYRTAVLSEQGAIDHYEALLEPSQWRRLRMRGHAQPAA